MMDLLPRHPYEPWNVSERDFPSTGSSTEQAQFLVRYALLAANSHNTQPWKFRTCDSLIEVVADMSRALPYSDPLNRELFVSLGCAIGNILVAASYFGFAPEVSYLPLRQEQANEPVARIRLLQPAGERIPHAALFPAIPVRRINRYPYDIHQPVKKEVLDEFRSLNDDELVDLCFVTDPALREQVLDIIEQSTLATQGDDKIVAEWTRWMRSKYTWRSDGLPLAGDFGIPGPLSLLAPLMFRFANGKKQAQDTRQLFATAPVFFVIASSGNGQEHWMRVGKVLTYLGLATTLKGIALAPWGAVVEHEESAQRVSAMLHTSRPLFFGRLGYTSNIPHHSPRRKLERVLM